MDATEKAMDRRIDSMSAMTLVNLSDTADVMLDDVAALYTDDDMQNVNERDPHFPRAFHSNATGFVNVLPPGNWAGQTVQLSLVAGTTYKYKVKRFYLTGASGIGDGQIIAMR